MEFLGHETDGRAGAEKGFDLAGGKSVTYPDLLGQRSAAADFNAYG